MCMLHSMLELRERFDFVLRVAHVDHRTRGTESMKDAEFVRERCREFGIAFHIAEFEMNSGRFSEEHLRRGRYELLAGIARQQGIDTVALGHTADDLVETFLMHLVRGTGTRGVTFSFRVQHEGLWIVRPIWRTWRVDVLRYLAERKLEFREDASNADLTFTRNRVRHLLIPMLEKEFNPAVRVALLQAAQLIAPAEDHGTAVLATSQDFLDCARVCALPEHQRIDAIVRWLESRGLRVTRRFEHLRALARWAVSGRGGSTFMAGPGCMLTASLGRIVIGDAPSDNVAYQATPLAQPNSPLSLEPGRELCVEAETQDGSRMTIGIRIDGGLKQTLLLRNRRGGDRLPGGKKLKEVLIDDKVPVRLRERLLVIASESRVVHVIGMPRINGRIEPASAEGVTVRVKTKVI